MNKTEEMKARVAAQMLNYLLPKDSDWTVAVNEFSDEPLLKVYPPSTGVCVSGDPLCVLEYLKAI